ncbi:MAG: hypothetical protein OQL08_13570 [Gammaproteobacteria bacterium]|nr:hypothetical protein [Gammaproteobacteria bacterium]
MSMITRLFLLSICSLPLSAETVWTLSAADWARPRHGEWLVAHPALQGALEGVQRSPRGLLQLRYPGGDEGVLWVEELQAWLVALGLESERIETLPGSGAEAAIQLVVIEK